KVKTKRPSVAAHSWTPPRVIVIGSPTARSTCCTQLPPHFGMCKNVASGVTTAIPPPVASNFPVAKTDVLLGSVLWSGSLTRLYHVLCDTPGIHSFRPLTGRSRLQSLIGVMAAQLPWRRSHGL